MMHGQKNIKLLQDYFTVTTNVTGAFFRCNVRFVKYKEK